MNGQVVELAAAGMEPGTSMRDLCPRCGGGSERERSLSLTLTEDGYLLWHCFRASCGFSGKRTVWGVVGGYQPTQQKAPQVFRGALKPIIDETWVWQWLWEKFKLHFSVYHKLGWRFAPESDRLYIPYFGPKGQFRGALLREWKNKLIPKNLVFKELRDEPFIGWFPQVSNDRPVLVEDAISACKVYQSDINSISLCGTHLSTHMVREILTKHKEAILALDKDATAKAVAYAGTYRELIGLRVWQLDKDLKYESEETIRSRYNAC